MKNIRIYYTSDIHGNLMPVDYTGIGRKKGGLLPIAGEIVHDGNTLVIDGGDSLQGTPLVAYYLEHAADYTSHPVADAFGAMGLNVFTLGNHDFNFGYEAIRSYVEAMKAHGAVCVCANVTDLGGEIPIIPWQISVLENGLRVGITGAVTDYVNVWEKPEHLTKLKVGDALEAVRKALAEMKQAGCDLTICIYHGGYERDLSTGKLLSDSRENRACLLGEELDFDLLLTGHQHMAVEKAVFGNTFSCQPPDKADRYILLEGCWDGPEPEAEGNTEENSDGNADGNAGAGEKSGWRFDARLIHAGDTWNPEGFEELLALEKRTQHWLDEKIGTFAEPLLPESKLDAALYGSRVAALVNEVQLTHVKADFSCTSLTNDPIGFAREVSIRDVYTAYPFANVSVLKQITGRTLKLALERCASYLELADGKPVISDRFLKPKIEHYNYDFYAGIDYAFDIRRPLGDRVVRLLRLDGTPIEEDGQYTLVCSDYRASGTGGYEMIGESPVLWTGADNMQDLLIGYIREHALIKPAENVRFRVIWQ